MTEDWNLEFGGIRSSGASGPHLLPTFLQSGESTGKDPGEYVRSISQAGGTHGGRHIKLAES